MSPNDSKANPASSKAAEMAQPVNMIVGQPPKTSSPSVVKSETNTSESPSMPSHNASQATETTTSQPTPVKAHEVATDKCTNCAGPASLRCTRCADGVDVYGRKSPTIYCSTDCQRQHWAVHRIECRPSVDRGELYKIGSLLQWSFYGGRKAMWHEDVGRVKKIEQTGEDNEAKLLVWRDKSKDYSRHTFPAFPHSLFDQERDKQALLAHEAPGVSMVTGLLIELLKASKYKIKIKEVAIRPRVHRFTRFVSRISVPGDDTSISWLFCATLRDGSSFAIDVCNAQYSINSSEDADRGVFPWEQYMERLSVTHGDLVREQALEACLRAQMTADLTGTAADVQAGILTAHDKQIVARVFVSTLAMFSVLTLPLNGLTLTELMGRSSPGFDEGVKSFKTCHQKGLDGTRKMIDDGAAQWMLLERFAAGAWMGGVPGVP